MPYNIPGTDILFGTSSALNTVLNLGGTFSSYFNPLSLLSGIFGSSNTLGDSNQFRGEIINNSTRATNEMNAFYNALLQSPEGTTFYQQEQRINGHYTIQWQGTPLPPFKLKDFFDLSSPVNPSAQINYLMPGNDQGFLLYNHFATFFADEVQIVSNNFDEYTYNVAQSDFHQAYPDVTMGFDAYSAAIEGGIDEISGQAMLDGGFTGEEVANINGGDITIGGTTYQPTEGLQETVDQLTNEVGFIQNNLVGINSDIINLQTQDGLLQQELAALQQSGTATEAELAVISQSLQAVQSEIATLQQQASDYQTAIDNRLSGLDLSLAAEITARVAGDIALQNGLELETAARIAADIILENGLAAEIAARIAGDLALQNGLDVEASARIASDTALQNGIDAESASRLAADIALQNGIDTEASARIAADIALQNGIDAEASARIAGDIALRSALENGLSTEQAARIAGDLAIQNAMDNGLAAEVAARIAGDIALQSGIDAETATRITADLALQAGIDQETADRIAADITLQGNLDNVSADLQGQITTGLDIAQQQRDEINSLLSVTNDNLSTVQGEVATLQQQYSALIDSGTATQAQLDAIQQEISALQEQDQLLQGSIANLDNMLTGVVNSITTLDEANQQRFAGLDEADAAAMVRLASLEIQDILTQQQITDLDIANQQRFAGLDEADEATQQRITDTRNQLEIDIQTGLDQAAQGRLDLQGLIDIANNDLTGIRNDLDTLAQEHEALRIASEAGDAEAQARMNGLQSQISDLQAQETLTLEQLDTLSSQISALQNEDTNLQNQIDILQQAEDERQLAQAIADQAEAARRQEQEQFLADNPLLPDTFFELSPQERETTLFVSQSDEFLAAEAAKTELITAQQQYEALLADENATQAQKDEAKSGLDTQLAGFLTSMVGLGGGQLLLGSLGGDIVSGVSDTLGEDININLRSQFSAPSNIPPQASLTGLMSRSQSGSPGGNQQFQASKTVDLPRRKTKGLHIPVQEKSEISNQSPFAKNETGLLTRFNEDTPGIFSPFRKKDTTGLLTGFI